MAEDWLRPDPVAAQATESARPSEEDDIAGDEREDVDEQEDVVMVQRPPWQNKGRDSRSRSRERRQREAERRDARDNNHRPWRRTSSTMSARPSGSRAAHGERVEAAVAGDCRPTGHPATVVLDNGTTENLGVHAWRVLLDMADPFAAPPAASYGLHEHQRRNIRASLESMNSRQQCQLLSSFLRMLQMLIAEVAGLLEENLGSDDVVVQAEGDLEGDESGLMHRFLLKPGDVINEQRSGATSSTSVTPAHREPGSAEETNAETVRQLLGDPFEMEVRAMVAALELGSPGASRARAQGLLERAKLQFGVGLLPRDALPSGLEQLESALLTFLPSGYEDEDEVYYFQNMPPSHKDFIDYWWRLMFRYLRQDQTQQADTSTAGTTLVSQEDYALADEEMRLMKELDDVEKREAKVIAESEFAALQDSQASEDAAFADRAEQVRAAGRYRDWEEWELAQAMQRPPKKATSGTSPGSVERVRECDVCSEYAVTMHTNQTLSLRLSITTPSCPGTTVAARETPGPDSRAHRGDCAHEGQLWSEGMEGDERRCRELAREPLTSVPEACGGGSHERDVRRLPSPVVLPESMMCGADGPGCGDAGPECDHPGMTNQHPWWTGWYRNKGLPQGPKEGSPSSCWHEMQRVVVLWWNQRNRPWWRRREFLHPQGHQRSRGWGRLLRGCEGSASCCLPLILLF